MKKVLLFTALIYIATLTTFAQNLSLIDHHGHPLANGDTVKAWVDTSTAVMKVHIDVKNIGSSQVYTRVKKIEISLVPNTINYYCWTSCYSSGTYLAPDTILLQPNEITSNFSGDYMHNMEMGTTTILYVFFSASDPNDSVGVYVQYNVTGVGIKEAKTKEIKFSNPYPNPSDNFTSFDYLLPKATKNSKIVIRNILGIVVKEVKIFNKKGNIKLSTEELTDGIYFYSIIVNDNIFITKRLIVRH